MTTGVVFRPQSPPEQLRAAVEAAEAAGVDELWLWEDCFLEGGLTTATAALAWSERITVGIGLLPVPFRNPALAGWQPGEDPAPVTQELEALARSGVADADALLVLTSRWTETGSAAGPRPRPRCRPTPRAPGPPAPGPRPGATPRAPRSRGR